MSQETIASVQAAWMEFTNMDCTQGRLLNKFLIYSHNSHLELHYNVILRCKV